MRKLWCEPDCSVLPRSQWQFAMAGARHRMASWQMQLLRIMGPVPPQHALYVGRT